MIIYLLHFDRPYYRAQHYMGITTNLPARLTDHQKGNGARLMAAITQAGIGFQVVQTWEGDRTMERHLKRQKHHWRHCPVCRAARRRQ